MIQGLKGYLSLAEFTLLVAYINENHSFAKNRGKRVKYITPIYDTRTQKIFCLQLRLSGEDLAFSITNEDKDKDLAKWVYCWLEEGKWGSTEVTSDVKA